jgi:hypothetical protein
MLEATMPPKRITVTPVGQGNISFMFKKAASTVKEPKVAPVVTPAEKTTESDEIQMFYSSLSEKEKIGYAIAVEKLGTSYDVCRTHGFLRWKSLRK